jgi:mannan endo-1,4-beta-mannosidase
MLYGTTAKSVTLQVGGKSYPMLDADHDGYYTAHVKSAELGYGEREFKVDVVKSDGSTVSETIKAEINKPVLAYEPVTVYDFSEGTSGWVKEGTWQADWQNPAVEATKELGKPMLKANVIWSGKNDWEEVKIRNMRVLNFRKSARMSFDTLIPAEGIFSGELRPYAALGDGWIKLDSDKNTKPVADLERVNIGGKMFIKHHVEINMGDVAGRGPDVFICLVGNKLKYEGPIYIDNLTFLAAKR